MSGTSLFPGQASSLSISGPSLSSCPDLLVLVDEVLLLFVIVDIPLLFMDKVDFSCLLVFMVKEVQLLILFVPSSHHARD